MDQLKRAINDIIDAGFPVKETLQGYFSIETEMLERKGEIGDEYCWSHSGVGCGGWICYTCNLSLFFEVLSKVYGG